jgi:hypothetical protein
MLDAFCVHLDDEDIPLVICPPYYIPSSRFTDVGLPFSLPRHFLSLLPTPRSSAARRRSSSKHSTLTARPTPSWSGAPSAVSSSVASPTESDAKTTDWSTGAEIQSASVTNNFLGGMRGINMNLNMDAMDVRKWNWGALTFSKGLGKKPDTQKIRSQTDSQPPASSVVEKLSAEPQVDIAALNEAMGTAAGREQTKSETRRYPLGDPKVEPLQEEAHSSSIIHDFAEPPLPPTNSQTLEPALGNEDDTLAETPEGNTTIAPVAVAGSPLSPSSVLDEEQTQPTISFNANADTSVPTSSGSDERILEYTYITEERLLETAPPSLPDSEVSSLAPSSISGLHESPASSNLALSASPPPLAMSTVHLAVNEQDPLNTAKRRVLYTTVGAHLLPTHIYR